MNVHYLNNSDSATVTTVPEVRARYRRTKWDSWILRTLIVPSPLHRLFPTRLPVSFSIKPLDQSSRWLALLETHNGKLRFETGSNTTSSVLMWNRVSAKQKIN